MYQTQKMTYFSSPVDDGTGKMTTLLSLVKNRYKGENVELDTATIFNECGLTQKEKDRVGHYYLDGMTLEQIGELENISKEAVRKSIENGIKKLREHREEII
jgi:DNA-directed RNA polymerase sigma subunit (sigma70/sigma32)